MTDPKDREFEELLLLLVCEEWNRRFQNSDGSEQEIDEFITHAETCEICADAVIKAVDAYLTHHFLRT